MNETLNVALNVAEKAVEKADEPTNLFVCLLGIGTVFLGLICLIILCKIIGAFSGKENKTPTPAPVATTKPVVNEPIENRQEIVAAVSAVIAEELGTDISALRILAFKKI